MGEKRIQYDPVNATSSAIAVPFANLLIFNENLLSYHFLNWLFAMNLLRGLQNAVPPAHTSYNCFPFPPHLARETISAAQPPNYFAICGKWIKPLKQQSNYKLLASKQIR
jgi:hypothetical protein